MWVSQCCKLALTAGKETIHFNRGWHKRKRKREEKRKRKEEQGKVQKEKLETEVGSRPACMPMYFVW